MPCVLTSETPNKHALGIFGHGFYEIHKFYSYLWLGRLQLIMRAMEGFAWQHFDRADQRKTYSWSSRVMSRPARGFELGLVLSMCAGLTQVAMKMSRLENIKPLTAQGQICACLCSAAFLKRWWSYEAALRQETDSIGCVRKHLQLPSINSFYIKNWLTVFSLQSH